MTTSFKIEGPFPVPVFRDVGGRTINEDGLVNFWERTGCAEKIGCYVYALKGARGALKPWYVGKATKRFKQECFTERNHLKYVRAFTKIRMGTPYMFFLSQIRKKGPANKKAIGELERYLINAAFQVNGKIENDIGIKGASYKIQGIGDPGMPSKSRRSFWRMLDL